jgi:aerobic carbon-monoxide dehydrogenase large subunit
MPHHPLIGTDLPRLDRVPLLTGEARFVADLDIEGQAHARVVRSTVPHATIEGIDTSAALAHPGVLAVITAEDLPEDLRIPIRLPFARTAEADEALQQPLARGVVRYVGEPVAVVVAEDAYTAENAAELVVCAYREQPAAATIEGATRAGAPLVHAAHGTNTVNTITLAHGDVDEAFARADVVVRDRLHMHRHAAVPMENRGLLACADPRTGRLTVWGVAKVKHFTRQMLAAMLRMDEADLRLVEVHVGGSFGARGEPYPEDYLIPFLARRLGRPVKWLEDRAEHLTAVNHDRESHYDVEVAASAAGELLAFRSRGWCDHGAFVRTQGIVPELMPVLHLPGPYRWQAFSIESTGVLTHRTPVGTYRAPGMTGAAYVRERMIDRVAAELRLDPADLRRRNLLPPAALPHSFAPEPGSSPLPPVVHDSGDYPAGLARLLKYADYPGLREQQQWRRAGGELVGIGLSAYTEISGVGPFEEAEIVPGPDGGFTVRVGVASVGQGVETALTQIAADCLGVPADAVAVDFSTTDAVPMGFGAFASRATSLAGNAIALAAGDLRAKAAAALRTEPDGVRFEGGAARGGDGAEVPLADLGSGRGRFDKPYPTCSFGAALCVVSVEADTGRVRVERHVVAHDVGRAVNPALLHGQLAGAAAQGIGATLLEELPYDAAGRPLVTSLSGYGMATAAELPDPETLIIEDPAPGNPLGIKGGGEAGMVGTPAAVANAVADALGTEVTRLPLTPDRVRWLLRQKSGS